MELIMIIIKLKLPRNFSKLVILKSLLIITEYFQDLAPLYLEFGLLHLSGLISAVVLNLTLNHHDNIYQDEQCDKPDGDPSNHLPDFEVGHEVCEKQESVSDEHMENII